MVEDAVKSHSLQNTESTTTKRDYHAQASRIMKFQRGATGNVAIAEVDSDRGRFVTLENTHRTKDEDVSGWKLRCSIDNRREINYTFPPRTIIKPGYTVKVNGCCYERFQKSFATLGVGTLQ